MAALGDTGAMRTYGQYCPIARAAEIFAERWTPIIVRNLSLGAETFTEIQKGAPGIPKSLLTQRLALLERTGLVERQPHPNGRGTRYSLTDAGRSLADVGVALGEWGARWLEIAPQHLDPYVVLWAMCGSVRWDLVPDRRIVVRLRFPDERKWRSVFWLLYERGRAEVCLRHPGGEDDLSITAVVDNDGVVRQTPQVGAQVVLSSAGDWQIQSSAAEFTDAAGQAYWRVVCGSAGPQPLYAFVGPQSYALNLPACVPAFAPTPTTGFNGGTTSTTAR